ncbi:type II toxin-antitoxin system HicB family antitoxin [Hyphomicrobium sp. 99]|uniref:type II toxin-antitoxin system HicB family antitoxin n=1 Tax=Methylopila sp. 73B TaxID=1120792 RepID=UPI000371B260
MIAMPHVYALVHEERGSFGISFPDFPGCISGGHTLDEAIRRGAKALNFHVAGMVEGGERLPTLRSLDELRADAEFVESLDGGDLALVKFGIPDRCRG